MSEIIKRIKIFQPKEVMREYRKWMKANHKYDRVYAPIGCMISALGIGMWYLGYDSDFVSLIAVFPFFTVMILQMHRHNQYNKQTSKELRRI